MDLKPDAARASKILIPGYINYKIYLVTGVKLHFSVKYKKKADSDNV